MAIISIEEALKILEAVDERGDPIPCALTVITCDLNRNRGGERLVYTNAVLCKATPSAKKAYRRRNNTRNIKGLGNDQIRAINPLLITHINGQAVGY